MAKLDQSFIKAYGHVGGRTAASRTDSASREPQLATAPQIISAAPVVVDANSFSVDTSCYASTNNSCTSSMPAVKLVRTHEEHPAAPPKKPRKPAAKRDAAISTPPPATAPAVTTFQADSLSVDTFAAAERPAETPKPAVKKPAPLSPKAVQSASEPLCHRACTIQFSTVAELASHESIADEVDDCDEELLIEDEHEEVVHEQPVAQQVHPPVQHREYSASATVSAPRIEAAAYHRVAAPTQPVQQPSLRAGYEVDAFRWPEVVNGLSGRATTALSTLIDELVDASSAGRGAIMFAGERRGAGTTTLAIYAARRMAELGLSVALVDADFAKPMLARSLGVAVEYGWDDAIQSQADFAAAMIASLEDGVSILPARQASMNNTGARAARIAEDLATLRKHFALVLLDGGPLAEVAEPWLNHAPEDTIDCGIVVRDVRLDAARRGPSKPHPSYPAIGVVENFVSDNKSK
jgi:Mrp family chromosome partitioning ATPase